MNEEDELREEVHDIPAGSEEALAEVSEASTVTAEIAALEATMANQVKAIAETHAEIAKIRAEIKPVAGRGYRDSKKSKMLADKRQAERDADKNEHYHGKKNSTIRTCNTDQERFDTTISTPNVCSARDVCQLMVIMDAHQVRKTTVGPEKYRLPDGQGVYYSPYKVKYSMLKSDGMKRSTSCSFGQMKWLFKKALYDTGKSECGRILNDHSPKWYKANRMLLNAIANYWCPSVWTEQLARKDHCEVQRKGRQVKYGLTMEGCAQVKDQTLEEFMGGSLFKTGKDDTGAAPGWSLIEDEAAEASETVEAKIDELVGEISKLPERSEYLETLQDQLVHAKSQLE